MSRSLKRIIGALGSLVVLSVIILATLSTLTEPLIQLLDQIAPRLQERLVMNAIGEYHHSHVELTGERLAPSQHTPPEPAVEEQNRRMADFFDAMLRSKDSSPV